MEVSVILTTHTGRKKVLERAINSVLGQTFKDWELLVVDDASRDGTKAYLEKVVKKDKRVKHIRFEKCSKNHAVGKNEGTRQAKGKYIAYLDSDNAYTRDHLQVLYNEIEKEKVDVVYGNRKVVEEEQGNVLGIGSTSDYNPRLLLTQNYIDTSDFLVKKEALIDIGGWDERSKRMLDWNLLCRMAKMGKTFKHVNLIITDYYVGGEGKLSLEEETNPWTPVDVEIELPYLKTPKDPRVAIFSLTYDRLKLTKKCFKSLKDTAGYDYDHYIYDNGSKDGTHEWLEKNDFTFVYFSGKNAGISHASNSLLDVIKAKDYDIIVKVDNDCLFQTGGWLKEMVEIWKRNRKLALSCYINGLRDHPGGADRYAYGFINQQLIGLTRHLGGICHFVDASAYDKFRWDETQPLHGIQDLEFSNYLNNNGYDMGYLENYHAEHIYGTEEQEKMFPEYFERRKEEKKDVFQR